MTTDMIYEPAALVGAACSPAENPAVVYLAGLADGSRRTMQQALHTIAQLSTNNQASWHNFQWSSLRYGHCVGIRTLLAQRYAPATANKMLAALKSTLKVAWKLGLMPAEDYHQAVSIKPVKASALPKGRALSLGELGRLMHATEEMPGAAGARDAALLAIMSGAGLRRSEVVALQLADWTPADRGLLIRHGKGNKDRQVYISAGRGPIVERWIALRGDTPGALLCPVNKSGVVTIRQMTAQAVLVILERLAELAGVADFSPHDLRRTYISIMLDSGADLSSIQKIAGHSRAETTARYDRRGEVAKQRTADMMPELD